MKAIDLDDLDRRIIARLADDARASNRQIARELEVSEGAIRARLKRLHDAGAIRLTVITNAALSDRSPAFLWITLTAQCHADQVARDLKAICDVTFVSTLIGRADILAITRVRDVEELSAFIHAKIDPIAGIQRTDWTLGHGFIKHLYGRCAIVD